MIDSSIGYCFLRALAICIHHKEKKSSTTDRQWIRIKSDVRRQMELVDILVDQYGIIRKEIVDSDDIQIIQRMISSYRIVVIDRLNWRNIIFNGGGPGIPLYIEFDSCSSSIGHYNPILNMKRYIERSYFCEKCHVGYKNRHQHKCNGSCRYCLSSEQCAKEIIRTHCSTCNIIFPSNGCYLKHTEKKLCGHIKKCEKCDQEWITRFKHECSATRCRKCNLNVKPNHSCFMKPLDLEKMAQEDSQTRVMIFFDIECYQREQTLSDTDELIHCPMLLISKTLCDKCISLESPDKTQDPCEFCGRGLLKFWGPRCVENFADYLYNTIAPKVESQRGSVTVFAHNGKGYDFHFILRDLFRRGFTSTDLMMNGNKIMHLRAGNISFVDSLLFFGQSLASLPKAFGISDRVIKGFFPHQFNKPENWMYEGSYPRP